MTMKEQLAQYYERVRIEPVSGSYNSYDEMFSAFRCCRKEACRKACLDAFCRAGNKKEDFLFQPHTNDPPTATTIVSPYYQDRKYHGDCIPRIVVLSLSIPQPEKDQDDEPAENPKTLLRANTHWPNTLVTVRSLLHHFIVPEKFPAPVRYWEDESREEIENLFVHVRTAKCCSNAGKTPRAQEPAKVYANCGKYLGEELSILKPDVIVTQGNKARDMAKRHAFNAIEQVKGLDLECPIAHIANLKEGNQSVYWLPMTFPVGRYRWRWILEAGDPILSDVEFLSDVEPLQQRANRAKRKNLVRYSEEIKKFMKNK